MNKKLLLIVGAGIILFLASMYLGMFAHERYHKWEMRDVEKTNESLCVSLFANCDGDFGYHHFIPDTEEANQKALEIVDSGLGWEFRAYSFQALISVSLILFVGLLILMLYKN